MAINLDNVYAITHNNKDVVKIEDSNGKRIWETPRIFYASSQLMLANDEFLTSAFGVEIKGNSIWSDGAYWYYSDGTTAQYILDFENYTYTTKTWTGFASPIGSSIVKIGDFIYYFGNGGNYILGANDTWTQVTFTLPTSVTGSNFFKWNNSYWAGNGSGKIYEITIDNLGILTFTEYWNVTTANIGVGYAYWSPDGINLYFSNGSTHYSVDLTNKTRTTKTWNGLTSFKGSRTFKYKGNVCVVSEGASPKIWQLDISTDTWTDITSQFINVPAGIRGDYFFDNTGHISYALKPEANLL